ncbi:MAG: toxin-antitoxin system YwqK family antitoxin, partial [Clostridiales bacterium]
MKSKLIIIILLGCAYISLFGQKDINPNGYNKIFYPNGSLQSEGRLVNGKPEGYWRNYYPTGVLKSEGSRKNNLLDSIWIFYSITGDTISKIHYLNGKKNGYSIEFFANAKNPLYKHNINLKELYVNNRKEGKSFYYYEDGKIKEVCNYENNLKEGEAIEYAEDGRVISIKKYRKGTLVDREKVNRFTEDNRKNKVWKEFYPNGKLKSEAYFKNGVLD